MTGNKYSAVRRSIAKLLASKDGRAALDLNNYESGTPIVTALEDEPLGDFYKRVDDAAVTGQPAIAAVLIDGELQMARVTSANAIQDDTRAESTSESVTADPQTTVGMLFTMLSSHKHLGLITRPFDDGKNSKMAVSFEMPGRGDSLQSA